MTKTRKILRSALIGYGGGFDMGRLHGRHMNRVGIELSAVCDKDPSRLEEARKDFPNIAVFTEADDLLQQAEVDLVAILTPHNSHASLAEKVLRSGRHCIIEKPMCIHAEDADRLIQLADQKGLMLSVFHNRRWDGWYLTVKDLLADGKLGEIFHVEMFKGGFIPPKGTWRDEAEITGGAFYMWGAHYIDYLLGLIPGKIESVRGTRHKRLWHQKTNADQIDSFIHFENGAAAHVQITSIARAPKAAFRILGTKGAVVVEEGSNKLYLYHGEGIENNRTEVEMLKKDYGAYYDNIADYFMHGAELIVKPEEARRVVAVIETTEKSARLGQELSVPFE